MLRALPRVFSSPGSSLSLSSWERLSSTLNIFPTFLWTLSHVCTYCPQCSRCSWLSRMQAHIPGSHWCHWQTCSFLFGSTRLSTVLLLFYSSRVARETINHKCILKCGTIVNRYRRGNFSEAFLCCRLQQVRVTCISIPFG